MKRHRAAIFIILFCLFTLMKTVHAGRPNIEVSGWAEGNIDEISIENDINNIAEKNGPAVADSFALANIVGYPIGKSNIGTLPHFEIGVSLGAGCTNMKYFNEDDPASTDGTLPVISPNAIAHIGLGLAKGIDVLAKLFYLDKSVYDPEVETDMATLTEFKMYSIGGKIRYNLVKRKPIFPYLLELGGITISLGGDFMHGNFGLTGEYEYELSATSVELPAPLGTQEIPIEFIGEYDSYIKWSIFSLTAQVIAYCDLFYFFSLYSGFGLSGNFGRFEVGFDGEGTLTTTNAAYEAISGTAQIGTLTFTTENKYKPAYVIPTYILGLEINILIVKLNFETMVNMHNRSDVNIQAGVRFEI